MAHGRGRERIDCIAKRYPPSELAHIAMACPACRTVPIGVRLRGCNARYATAELSKRTRCQNRLRYAVKEWENVLNRLSKSSPVRSGP